MLKRPFFHVDDDIVDDDDDSSFRTFAFNSRFTSKYFFALVFQDTEQSCKRLFISY